MLRVLIHGNERLEERVGGALARSLLGRAPLAGVQCAVHCHSGYEWAAAALGEGDVLVLAAAVLAQ